MSNVALSPVLAHFDQVDRVVAQSPDKAKDLHEFYLVNPNNTFNEYILESRMYKALKIISIVAFVILVGGAVAIGAVLSLGTLPLSIITSAILTELFYRYIYLPLDKSEKDHLKAAGAMKTIIQTAHHIASKTNLEIEDDIRYIAKDRFDDALAKVAFLDPANPVRGFIKPLTNYHLQLRKIAGLEKTYNQLAGQLKKRLSLLHNPREPFDRKVLSLISINNISSRESLVIADSLIQAKIEAVLIAVSIIDPTRKHQNFWIAPLHPATHTRLHDIEDQHDFTIGFKKDIDGNCSAITRSDILNSSVEELTDRLLADSFHDDQMTDDAASDL